MTDSLCTKPNLADSFIPCGEDNQMCTGYYYKFTPWPRQPFYDQKNARTSTKGNHVNLLPAETAETLGRKLFTRTVSEGSYLPSTTVPAEAKYDGQSLHEAKLSGLVYTLWRR